MELKNIGACCSVVVFLFFSFRVLLLYFPLLFARFSTPFWPFAISFECMRSLWLYLAVIFVMFSITFASFSSFSSFLRIIAFDCCSCMFCVFISLFIITFCVPVAEIVVVVAIVNMRWKESHLSKPTEYYLRPIPHLSLGLCSSSPIGYISLLFFARPHFEYWWD